MPHSIKILLVDDEPYNLIILQEYLEEAGYQVEAVDDGAPAWEILQERGDEFSCVLLDRMMPDMDGIEVVSRMKQHGTLRIMPVIMQTAAGSTAQIREGIEAGVFYYLIKPYTKGLLLSLVRSAISENSRRRRVLEQLHHQTVAGHCLDSAHFTFQTIAEVQDIAYTVASWLPDPMRVAPGLTELMINAIEHGNLGISYDEKSRLLDAGTWIPEIEKRSRSPEHAHKRAELFFTRGSDAAIIRITDMGKGFHFEPYLTLNPHRLADAHGRGIAMAKALAFDTLEFSENGSHVTASVTLPAGSNA